MEASGSRGTVATWARICNRQAKSVTADNDWEFDDPRNIENPYGLRRSWQMEEGEGRLDVEMEFVVLPESLFFSSSLVVSLMKVLVFGIFSDGRKIS